MLRQNLIKSMANCQNLLNDVKSRDHTIKTLKYEIDTLKKNFEDNKKKLNRSEREVTTLKKRETQFLENIKEVYIIYLYIYIYIYLTCINIIISILINNKNYFKLRINYSIQKKNWNNKKKQMI